MQNIHHIMSTNGIDSIQSWLSPIKSQVSIVVIDNKYNFLTKRRDVDYSLVCVWGGGGGSGGMQIHRTMGMFPMG